MGKTTPNRKCERSATERKKHFTALVYEWKFLCLLNDSLWLWSMVSWNVSRSNLSLFLQWLLARRIVARHEICLRNATSFTTSSPHAVFHFLFHFHSWNWKSASAAISPKKKKRNEKPNSITFSISFSCARSSRVEHKRAKQHCAMQHQIRASAFQIDAIFLFDRFSFQPSFGSVVGRWKLEIESNVRQVMGWLLA